jgi:hypothetical protein
MANYSCPMHPDVTSQQPGSCSKCGMRLEQKQGGGAGADANTERQRTSRSEPMKDRQDKPDKQDKGK